MKTKPTNMKKCIASLVLALFSFGQATAFDFHDTSMPERLFTFGLRASVNTSNLSDNYGSAIEDIHLKQNKWKAGFSFGAVVDLHVRNFFALQPGLFIQTRNNSYSYLLANEKNGYFSVYEGDRNSCHLQVPILASLRMPINASIQWQIDFGPYFLFGLGGDNECDYYSLSFSDAALKNEQASIKTDYFGRDGFAKDYDWGFKMGTGVVYNNHYYIGIHYEAGCRNVIKDKAGYDFSGRNKAWTFSLGYNF